MSYGSTLDEERRNLQNIATELAERPDLERWAVANPDIANHVGDIHKLYPWLPPGVTLALGTARYAPDDPFVKRLADVSMAFGRKVQSQGFGKARDILGDPSSQRALDESILGTTIGGVTPGVHKGLLDRAVGDVTGAVSAAGHAVGAGIPEPVRSGVKTGTRFAFAGLQSGLEGVEGEFRSALSQGSLTQAVVRHAPGHQIDTNPNPFTPLTPQLTVVQMINGRDSGKGFFPAGQAAEAAHQAQLRAGSITGSDGTPHALTVGRGIAGTVLPANSTAYNLVSGLGDAAVALYGDPANMALGGVGKLRAARAGFADPGTSWGAFDRFRQTLGIRTVAEQLNTRAGQGVVAKLRELPTSRDVTHFLHGKVEPRTALALATANSDEAVLSILHQELGTGIEALPKFHPRVQALTAGKATDDFGNPIDKGVGSLGYLVDRTTRNWRPLALTPGQSFPTDLSQFWAHKEAYRQMEAFLVNAKVEDSNIAHVLDRVAGATNRNEMYAAFTHGMDVTADTLTKEYGITKSEARKLTRAWTTGAEMKETKDYFMLSMTDKWVVPGMLVDGEHMTFEGPGVPLEHLNRDIHMPDFREIRRTASTYRKFIRSLPAGTSALKATDAATGVLDALMHTWKAAQLLRPALMVRILGESQLAIAASGDASILSSHPLHAISWITGKRGALDVLGNEFDPTDLRQVFKGGAHQVAGYDADRMWASQATQLVHGQPGFIPAWAQQVRFAHIDPLLRSTAQAMVGGDIAGKAVWRSAEGDRAVEIERSLGLGKDGREYVKIAGSETGVPLDEITGAKTGLRNVDELKEAFFSGHLRQLRVDMMEPGSQTWRNPAVLGLRSTSDAKIDETVARIRAMARDDPEIMNAIAGGKFRGEPLAHMKGGTQLIGRSKYERPPQSLYDRIGELDAEGNAPDFMFGHLMGKQNLGPRGAISGLWDHAVNRMFNMLVGERLEHLAISPEFRQAYYKELNKLLPYMDKGEAAKLIAGAEKANITGFNVSRAVGSLDMKTADTIAKSRSLDKMSTLLHDLGHRSQASDMLRFVAPFGDAWKKILTRWVKLVAQHPGTIERFRQGMHEATQSGFVHTDPQSGEQVFTIPFTAGIDKAITGLPFPQTAPLNGLSVVGSGLPGVGPAVSIPLGLLAPHVPAVQGIMDKVVPFGPPNTKQGMIEAFFPGWLQRFRTAGLTPPFGASPDQQSVFHHSVDQVLRYLVSNGADISTPEALARLTGEARHKATLLYAVRGFLQATSPSPPSVEYMVKDKGGRLTNIYLLTNELQHLYDGKGVDGKGSNDPEQATQIFLKLHGKSNYVALQAFSTPRRYGLPTTTGAAQWLRSHGGFKKQFPNVYGLLTPQKGAFDYSTYLGQIHSGERQDRTSEDFLRLANAKVAAMIYDQERDKLPDDANSADKSNYLGQLRNWLKEKYPGYQAADLEVNKATVPDAIAELAKAADDRAVRSTDAARGVRAYLQLRQQVIDFEKDNGSNVHSNTLSRSANFAGQHEWLAQQASRLITEFPTFFSAWDNLLSHEVTLTPTPTAGT